METDQVVSQPSAGSRDNATSPAPGEGLLEIDNMSWYSVPDVDRMTPFLMNVVSDGDRWMFVSSSGALTAGRLDAAGALFPYDTDDRLHAAAGAVGPATALRILPGGTPWRPFHSGVDQPVRRCLYKSVIGDSVIFEESDPTLCLRFRYCWASSDRYGFVRTATLINNGDQPLQVEVLDGLINLLPHGLDPSLYQVMGNLTNAYKRSEIIDIEHRLAVYSLESRVVDSPEPAESLRASVAWSTGFDNAILTVDPAALAAFGSGPNTKGTSLLTGKPGAYLLQGTVDLAPGEARSWHIVADVGQDQAAVTALLNSMAETDDISESVRASLRQAGEALVSIMAPADAIQQTGNPVATAHQFANVTYNVMRGGIPLAGYRIDSAAFAEFVADRNRQLADRLQDWFRTLPTTIDRATLLTRTEDRGDAHLIRLALEYLPFSFSRRHGDPSRPWNTFSIRVRDDAGRPIVHYEGNWRDIFQNWEALCLSFPHYLLGVISVFVNASTADGFNPYRITSRGIDWEVPDPANPWNTIGYWGDHQIVYLLRLLESAARFLPGEVERLLGERWFCYADVPYRLEPYSELVRDPKATIRYSEPVAAQSAGRTRAVGGDGKLLWNADGEPQLVTLTEKLLVPALAKLSHYVPGGGVWMNTQRPEWNDANNALVGYGVSMVTLCYLRRYLDHLRKLVLGSELTEVPLSAEVADWAAAVTTALRRWLPTASRSDDRSRKSLLDELGQSFSEYRSRVYSSGFSDPVPFALGGVVELCNLAIEHLDDTIRANRRRDELFHSYNLIHFSPDGATASVEPLYEMLEGQVAVLSSGVLSADERVEVIDALFASKMYRDDLDSFMLYPARELPSFLDKNVVPSEAVSGNALLMELLASGDRSVIVADVAGRVRFSADCTNQRDLVRALDRLATDPMWQDAVASCRDATLEAYEQVFQHRAYTGRSGSIYGYEGIGSIYWHMVAKLLVAVQESVVEAVAGGARPTTVARLVDGYRRIRSGLGFNKTAAEFGAIPIDPYSHSPAHAGAQQPGMTGLVKEELLTRPLETGVRVEDGQIRFDPVILESRELLDHAQSWRTYDLALDPVDIALEAGSLGTTMCQMPVIVRVAGEDPMIEVVFTDGTTRHVPGLALDRDTSAMVFARTGEIERITATIPATGDSIPPV